MEVREIERPDMASNNETEWNKKSTRNMGREKKRRDVNRGEKLSKRKAVVQISCGKREGSNPASLLRGRMETI